MVDPSPLVVQGGFYKCLYCIGIFLPTFHLHHYHHCPSLSPVTTTYNYFPSPSQLSSLPLTVTIITFFAITILITPHHHYYLHCPHHSSSPLLPSLTTITHFITHHHHHYQHCPSLTTITFLSPPLLITTH